ncbi:MAG: BCD family MFS transporter [Deltaproteobacteria bacterium]|nr:BCD family MFS transporter [Deltaproteobacteria bacterium]
MISLQQKALQLWSSIGPRFLPFADAATVELPLPRLLRLSLFQVSVGMALVLLNGTLNRVMIVELGIPAWLVAAMISLPLLFAPFRALIGYRSDTHRSALGWRRVPYIWMGSLIQFGGLSILPFALLVLSGDAVNAPQLAGELAAALAFLMIGAGLHTTQTAGLALATDLAPPDSRPRVVALLYMTLLLGMVVSALIFGALLANFEHLKLIKVIQGAAVVTMILNSVALWKQEPRRPRQAAVAVEPQPRLRDSWAALAKVGQAPRLLVVVALGVGGFNMQDILLEPFGGEILRLSVAATTSLTAVMAGGTLIGFALAARWLGRGRDPYHLAALGTMLGIVGLSAIIFSAPFSSAALFYAGTLCVGFGGGWFAVGTLTAAMALADRGQSGLAIGAWGAVQATAAGSGIALAGILRDTLSKMATEGALGPGLTDPSIGYSFVYHLEIALLFGTLVAVGPLVRFGRDPGREPARFGLAELPG